MTIHETRRRLRFPALGLVVASVIALGAATSASAAPAPVQGTATGSIGLLGAPVPLPASATFTGTHDSATGAFSATVVADDLALSLPISTGTVGVTAGFTNPGGFTGTVSGTTASLSGSVHLTLKDLAVPGISLPVPISFLNCSLTFPLQLTGTYDAASGVIDVTDPEVVVPQLPMLCATGILTATQVDVNALLAQLPVGSVTMRLVGAGATPGSTTTTTVAASAPPNTPEVTAPEALAAQPVTATPAYTG